MSFLGQGLAFLRRFGGRTRTLLVLECWDQRCHGSPTPAACRGWGKQFLYLGVKEIWNICCGKVKHTWTHESVRFPIQIGRQPVLILHVLFKLTAASKPGFSDEVADALAFSPVMCTTTVMFPDVGLFVALLSQLFEWYHANCVFGPVHMAAVAFRSEFPVPICDRRHLNPSLLCQWRLCDNSLEQSPQEVAAQALPAGYWCDHSHLSYSLVSSWLLGRFWCWSKHK